MEHNLYPRFSQSLNLIDFHEELVKLELNFFFFFYHGLSYNKRRCELCGAMNKSLGLYLTINQDTKEIIS